MENEEDKEIEEKKVLYNVTLTYSEFKYVTELLNNFYDNLSKIPKRFRTYKFYLLENMIQNKFPDIFPKETKE